LRQLLSDLEFISASGGILMSFVFGHNRTIPRFSMVLEVIEPGLLVVKYRRGQDPGKFNNIVVLEGDQLSWWMKWVPAFLIVLTW